MTFDPAVLEVGDHRPAQIRTIGDVLLPQPAAMPQGAQSAPDELVSHGGLPRDDAALAADPGRIPGPAAQGTLPTPLHPSSSAPITSGLLHDSAAQQETGPAPDPVTVEWDSLSSPRALPP